MSNNRRPSILAIAIIAMVVMIVAIIMWFKPDSDSAKPLQSTATEQGNNAIADSVQNIAISNGQINSSGTQSNSKFITGLEGLPRSLQGTEVDGEIIIDEQQQLVVTEGLRRLFDYFLSALGEEEEAVIHARVESYIRNHTPEPAASQAVAIFNQYVRYLKELTQIEQRYGNLQLQATKNAELDLNLVAQRKQDINKIRKKYFDAATISAFFDTEDDYDTYSIAMLTIDQNNLLSDSQKSAARQDYISRMPNSTTKENIEQQANLNELITRTEQMKSAGSTPEALYNMRRKLVGEAAAARLGVVDREDANFDQRFNQYQAQKQRILSQNADSAQARTELKQLEEQLFSDTERKRLSGYSDMQQSKTE